MPAKDWWKEERAALQRGFHAVAGIDEAGRGTLAGPVVAACVLLPFEVDIPGIRDSKTLSEKQREAAFSAINECALSVGIGMADAPAIDRLNILRATHHAMREAVTAMPSPPDLVLIDGLAVHPFPVPQIALVKGDSLSRSIAAASIIAKVTRDRLMMEQHRLFPQYGFAEHKGYGTAAHLAALEEFGPCAIHRKSFAPVARLLDESLLSAEEERNRLGKSGEIVAKAHLHRLGWSVLHTRYRCREGEIDIIARDGETLVFVEVKARRGSSRTVPAEAVHFRKRNLMWSAAQTYLYENGLSGDSACRFDVAEVIFLPDGRASVRLIYNAFMAGEQP
jgi:ribonuclease HII